jgi:hypothetical protein
MHKCIGHHQKAIAEARDRPDTKDPGYLNEWKLLFTMVNVLWKHRAALGEEEFARQRGHLEAWLDRLLAEPRTRPGDVAVQQRIGKRRGVVLGCLDDPAAEPTNNRAERSLRDPGVIARKVSCGNKIEAGKAARERLTSLAVSCQQRCQDFVSWLAACLPPGRPGDPRPRRRPCPLNTNPGSAEVRTGGRGTRPAGGPTMTADEIRDRIETTGYPLYVKPEDNVRYLVRDRSCLAWPSTHPGMVVVFCSGRQVVVLPLEEVKAVCPVDPPLRPGERRVTRTELETVAAKGPYRVQLANGDVFVMPSRLEHVW